MFVSISCWSEACFLKSKFLVAALTISISALLSGCDRPSQESEPSNRIASEYFSAKPRSLLFDGKPDPARRMQNLIHDLIVEDKISFAIVPRAMVEGGFQTDSAEIVKLFKGRDWETCSRQYGPRQLSPEERLRRYIRGASVRARYELLQGHCILIQASSDRNADVRLEYTKDHFRFTELKTGQKIASVRSPYFLGVSKVRKIFGDSVVSRPNTKAEDYDNITDFQLIRGLKEGGDYHDAVDTVFSFRIDVPRNAIDGPLYSVRKPVSRAVVEELIHQVNLNKINSLAGLIAGSRPDTGDLIWPAVKEILYRPFTPTFAFEYGEAWQKHLLQRMPLEGQQIIDAGQIPHFASSGAFQGAAQIVVRLGPPYTDLFYQEFQREVDRRMKHNSWPSALHILFAQQNSVVTTVQTKLSKQRVSPVRIASAAVLIRERDRIDRLAPAFKAHLMAECRREPLLHSNEFTRDSFFLGRTFCQAAFPNK